MTDELFASYHDLLDGTYDCVDRIVLNAYDPLGASAGGFRTWWRRLNGGSDEELDTAHLMRLAGRFSRRVRAFAKANAIPVIDCGRDERKHKIAEPYLGEHPQARGLFLILVARAVASVWDVERSRTGTIRNLEKKRAYVNHYAFHIVDPDWGHLTIKMSGHPPFGAQVLLNGHAYVACQGAKGGIRFTEEGNCFTRVEDVAGLARVADTLSDPRAIGQLSQLCDRWIDTSCLCFAWDPAEQERSGFRYADSVYQAESSRNLVFKSGAQMEQVFQDLVDRNRARVGIRSLRTIFEAKQRPRSTDRRAPRLLVTVETPVYGLTVFKLHFGKPTLKGDTKGERVLRFEAIAHTTAALHCGRVIAPFPTIVARLRAILGRALDTPQWRDRAFSSDEPLERLPTPARVGTTRVGGIDIGKPRMRAVLAPVLALAPAPRGFTAGELAAEVRAVAEQVIDDGARRAAYDLKKLRAKELVSRLGRSRRDEVPAPALRTIAAVIVLRDKVLTPPLAALANPLAPNPAARREGRRPKTRRRIDDHDQTLRITMHALLGELHAARA